ncbi:MAG: methylmalonyl-CoA mutase family protein [Desulfuromonadaceae bacterium]|nr:methylmalonyl-CoA mutase family protein [Desulfuromonadaceae bacterium]
MQDALESYKAKHKLRFVTATSLFDGHDVSINIIRRILQASGAEVIHLGHNRSVDEIVTAAIQEDAHGINISSYQGGHVAFFKYTMDLLRERGAGHIKVFGGGGGVIIPEEIKEIEAFGVTKIFSPEDGRRMGLQGMINCMLEQCDFSLGRDPEEELAKLENQDIRAINTIITLAEDSVHSGSDDGYGKLRDRVRVMGKPTPVLGITGTGGAGKSTMSDELVLRFLHDFPEKSVAILAVDPSRQRTGGALLGDRIRMNSITGKRVYMRSLATRDSHSELSAAIQDALDVVRASGFDLIVVETSGIGQGDASVVTICDLSLYVMTSEFGAPTQLEKIDMLDFADLVAINKFDRKGSEDALKNVKKQYRRNRVMFDVPDEQIPVYGTIASQFNDPGTSVLYLALLGKLNEKKGSAWQSRLVIREHDSLGKTIIPVDRIHYLGEIAQTVRSYRKTVIQQCAVARSLYQLKAVQGMVEEGSAASLEMACLAQTNDAKLHEEPRQLLSCWDELKRSYRQEALITRVRDKEIRTELFTTSLSGTRIPRVSVPGFDDWGDILRWLMLENLPGFFPFTAGVFPFKRAEEDPKRQFAGEGSPERTNKRFHYLCQDDGAKRLSTAFDSVTLYGADPDYPPDIYGKVGESGVSIATINDIKKLFAGFDLCAPSTSVSITINGPAPMMLAMFFNAAIDQQVERFTEQQGRGPDESEYRKIKADTLQNVRGTVQADILKEDQGQNTCLFSIDFALKMMGDIQQYFIEEKVRNYYSVSISGYHIAEAGANPITQLALTLSNGFTFLEYYLSRGMHIDDFAPNLSFFFSNGLDPEYTVIGRVARRIWAVTMREKYGANDRSQKLKYHIQTSGRSLHAQEMDFNDIRTTLQALVAIYDNCNSLHTNAYDEAVTTPTEESVRRAMAIQMIITKEFGLAKNENPIQGSFIIEELTDLVEEAVMIEFERIDHRGGVLGAMETQYQRSKIQDESMLYEHKKHNGDLPIVGVNTFLNPRSDEEGFGITGELARATIAEKEQQIRNLQEFQEKNRAEALQALERLKVVAMAGDNIFAEMMETVKYASLGQITQALFEVGGRYRRNM